VEGSDWDALDDRGGYYREQEENKGGEEQYRQWCRRSEHGDEAVKPSVLRLNHGLGWQGKESWDRGDATLKSTGRAGRDEIMGTSRLRTYHEMDLQMMKAMTRVALLSAVVGSRTVAGW
jgi:hypothetical protein